MRSSATLVALATACASSASALTLEKRENPKVLHFGLERSQPSFATREEMRERRWNRLGRRANTISETLDNYEDGSLYFANITIGTPGQKLRLHVDTGSSDIWTNTPTSQICEAPAQELEQDGYESCDVSGTYVANKSSTYKYINSDFFISYADTTGAAGDYVSDTLTIGGASITNQQFGVGYRSNSSEGVMGIGYPNLEVAVQYDRGKPYNNLPQNMAKLGLINTPSYSLWLDDLNSATGNILFGGVDTSKFTGPLTTVPILPEEGTYLEMIIALSGISIDNNGKNTTLQSQNIPVLLDSGSTLMYLPSSVSQSIFKAVGATYNDREGVATIDCSAANSNNVKLAFNFSGQTIMLDMSQLILQEDAQTCIIGIVPQSDDSTFTLGDTFLRNAYVVYDLDANTISLAQTNFNPGSGTNIKEIQSGSSGVPVATGASATASIPVTGTGAAYNGFPAGATASSVFGGSGSSGSSSSQNAAARPTGPALGALGAAVAGAGAILAAI